MRRALLSTAALAAALTFSACGSQPNEVITAADESDQVKRGSILFTQRCSGCHTLESAGAEGSAYEIGDRERPDGPNFNVRKECAENVLYAIRNGGYSGAIMPENIVVGQDAEDIAVYLEKYSGLEATYGAGSVPETCE